PIHVRSQVCKETCQWVESDLKAELDITSEDPLPLSGDMQTRLAEGKPNITVVPVKVPSPSAVGPLTPMPEVARPASTGLLSGTHQQYQASMEALAARLVRQNEKTPVDLIAFVLAGVFWGAVSLITPCVFPMIPITVSFFLKQSEKEHHKPITMALVYSATI